MAENHGQPHTTRLHSAGWEEFQREVVDKATWSPPTPDDVTRVKLDGPPATREEILAAFGQPIPDSDGDE